MTLTEFRLWDRLRGRKMDGWKFRRQSPIGEFIVDFYCPAAKLIVELNGYSHINEAQFDRDNRRQVWLESQGYKVLRFSALYPDPDNLEGVWDTISRELDKLPPPTPRRPHPRNRRAVI